MTSNTRRETYAHQLAIQQAELAAVKDDWENCQTAKQRLKYNKDIESSLNKIEELENKLKEIDKKSNVSTIKVPALDKNLKKIDFHEARRVASALHQKFEGQDDGFALMMLQRATKQMGHHAMEEMLDTIFGVDVQPLIGQSGGESCKVYMTDCTKLGEYTVPGFLSSLSDSIRDSDTRNSPKDTQIFQNTLCELLRSGDRVLILVKNWQRMSEPALFLKWFVEDFWSPLIDDIRRVVLPEYGRIRVVAMLISEGPVQSDYLNDITQCTVENHDPYHLIEIALSDWAVADIQKWLMDYQQLKRSESIQLAKQIHGDCEGTPQSIFYNLKERYSA